MSTIEILRSEAKQYIDEANEKVVRMVHALLEVNAAEDVSEDEEADWWENMPDDVKAEIEEAMKEVEEGKVIPHDEVRKTYLKWLPK